MKKFVDLETGDKVGFLRFICGEVTLESLYVQGSGEIGDNDGSIMWVPGLSGGDEEPRYTYYAAPREYEVLIPGYEVSEVFYKFFKE